MIVTELHQDGHLGRSECVPYARYGESVDSVRSEIEALIRGLSESEAREQVIQMAAGAARNAIDCALWDLEAKRAGVPVWKLAGFEGPAPEVRTMRTVSVDAVEKMGADAKRFADAPVIKVKVDGGNDLDRIAAVHDAAPDAELVVDANESWSAEQLRRWMPRLREVGVVVVEQPLRADDDAALVGFERRVPICADESFHDRRSFAEVEGRYDMVNVKLDKAGGLTEALFCVREARRVGLRVMVGCMVSTSLAIEPALLLTAGAAYVDLDGPLLLDSDREGSLHDRERGLLRASSVIWGAA